MQQNTQFIKSAVKNKNFLSNPQLVACHYGVMSNYAHRKFCVGFKKCNFI